MSRPATKKINNLPDMDRDTLRAELKSDVDAFLSKGGSIETLPMGKTRFASGVQLEMGKGR